MNLSLVHFLLLDLGFFFVFVGCQTIEAFIYVLIVLFLLFGWLYGAKLVVRLISWGNFIVPWSNFLLVHQMG